MGRMANIKMCSPVPLPLSDERFYYLIAAALYVENITIMEQHDRSLSHTYTMYSTNMFCSTLTYDYCTTTSYEILQFSGELRTSWKINVKSRV